MEHLLSCPLNIVLKLYQVVGDHVFEVGLWLLLDHFIHRIDAIFFTFLLIVGIIVVSVEEARRLILAGLVGEVKLTLRLVAGGGEEVLHGELEFGLVLLRLLLAGAFADEFLYTPVSLEHVAWYRCTCLHKLAL